jgi:hypothetical protein
MSIKKLALDLVVKISSPNISLEDLDQALKDAKKSMVELGDDGSEEFKKLNTAVNNAEKSLLKSGDAMGSFNGQTENFNKSLKTSAERFDDLSKKAITLEDELTKTTDPKKIAFLKKELKDVNGELGDTEKAAKGAAKGNSTLAKAAKGVGLAFKAMGIGIVVAALKFFFDALKGNQRVVDTFAKVTGTIGIVMNEVVSAIISAVDQVSKASQGFDGLKKVIGGLLTVAMTPLKLSFLSIKLAIEQAQLGWEQSFFGGGDEEKIKELRLGIEDTSLAIKETAVDAVDAGKDIVNNLGKAASEIGGVVSVAVESISKISIKAAAAQAEANVNLQNAAILAAANQQLLLEKADIAAEKQRQIRDEERNSITDRIAANEELGKVLDDQEAAMLGVANAQIAAARINNQINGTIESEVELINALANQKGVLAQIEGFRSEQKMNDLQLDLERLAMDTKLGDSEAGLAYARKVFDAEQISDKLKSLKELKRLAEEEEQSEMLRLETKIEMTKSGTQMEVDALVALDEFREQSRQANREANNEIQAEEENIAEIRKKRDEENKEALKQQANELLNNIMSLAIASSQAEEARLQDILNNTEEGTKAREKAEKALEKQKEKSFKIEQQAAIGRTIIDTAQGSIRAYISQIIPGDPSSVVRGAIAASLVAASGLAQVAAIKSQKFYGGGTSQISTPNAVSGGGGGGGMNGLQPTPFTSPNVNTQQQATRVIVTETDITNTVNGVDGIYRRAVVVQ